MTSRRILGELCLYICVLAIFVGETTALAQVRIKERLEIVPVPMVSDNRTLAEPAGAEMIASTGGVLKVKVNYFTSLNSPIPPDAHITIRIHGTTYTFPVSQYAGEIEQYTGAADDYCNLIFSLPVTEYVRSFREGMDSLYQLSGIETGDTMVFTYDGGGIVAGGVGEMDTDSTWDVYLSLRDDCLHSIAFPHGAFDRVWCWLTVGISSVDESLDHFAVRIAPDTLSEKDTVAFTETARVFVDAKGSRDEDIELDGSTLLSFSLESNDQYGTFIGVTGDTMRASPVHLQNISYQDAHAGKARFASLWRNPDSMVTCRIRVVLQTDPTKRGERDAVVLEKTLKIVMMTPHEVRPVISPATVANPTAENRKRFDVQMTRGGKPAGKHHFKLTSDYVDRSGAHDHEMTRNTRRPQSLQNYGCFQNGGMGTLLNPLNGQTGTNGSLEVVYTASIWGDSMRIGLQSMENSLLRDSLTVLETVGGLVQLPENSAYRQIGGTCNHFGPNATAQHCSATNNNHWGTQGTMTAVLAIARTYNAAFPNDEILSINDMSLPQGGRFDLSASWSGNTHHQYHRFGRDADVRSRTIPIGDTYRDLNHNGQYDVGEPLVIDENGNGAYDRNRERFEEICLASGVVEVLLESNPEHYHLFFWDRN
jgi:hypothetical protein